MPEDVEFSNVEVTGQMRQELADAGPGHVIVQVREHRLDLTTEPVQDYQQDSVSVQPIGKLKHYPPHKVLLRFEDLPSAS